MHYKEKAALLKMVHKTKGRMEKLLVEKTADVVRNPAKYSVTEMLGLYEAASLIYRDHLETIVIQQACNHLGLDRFDDLAQKAAKK